GEVYRAHDDQLDRDVALKVLPPGTIADETARKLFRKEALALAKLNHPNIETVFEFSTQDGKDFLAMELIPGSSLRERLKQGPLASGDVFHLGTQFVEGLAAAHEHGVVHRDLKPGNLLVTPDDRLKILDFGLAKLLRPGLSAEVTLSLTEEVTRAAGTLPYMAPEQLRGEAADARSDIYAAGAVLYEMATGRRPFPETRTAQLMNSILYERPTPPSALNRRVTPALETVILRALEKQVSRRYQSARELLAALESAKAGKGMARAWRAWASAGLSMLLVAGALTALDVGGLRDRLWKQRMTKAPIRVRRSLAVLGFKNLSGRPDQAWLSTALSEMLTTELDAGEQLRTIPGENVEQMKINLALPDAESYGKETLDRIRKTLGSDSVVLGSYLALGNGQVRLDVRLQDARAGETLASDMEAGSETEVSNLIARAGSRLREKLGVPAVSTADMGAMHASLPPDSEAVRFYSEGLAKLRHFDNLGARDLLQKAVAIDPEFALGHAALAAAWSALGYDARAKEEAKRAFELSAQLPREDRLSIEGRYRETSREWEKAIEVYRTLFGFFPDNLEYGLRLSAAQTSSGKAKDALMTVDVLRNLPYPAGDDPRIDLAEAIAATSLSDFKRVDAAANRAAAKAAAQGARLLLARTKLVQGNAFRNLGDPKRAADAYEEAKSVFAATGDQGGVAGALNSMAILFYEHGDLDGAKRMYEESLRISRSIGYQGGVARALNNTALVLVRQGDSAGAENLYRQALASFREVGDKRAGGLALSNIAHLRRNEGNFAGARSSLAEALTMFRETGDKSGVARVLNNMGIVLADQGELAQAKKSYEQSLAVCSEIGNKSLCANALAGNADVLLAEGDLPGARAGHEKALAFRKELAEEGALTESRLALAMLSVEEGHPADAEGPARDAAEKFRKGNQVSSEALADAILSRSLLAQGKLADAQASVERAEGLLQGSADRDARLFAAIIAARIRAASGNSAEAIRRLTAVLAEANKTGFVAHQLEAQLALGEIEMKSGKSAAGRVHLAAIEKESTQKGFLLIARKASAATQ
ncbi:MAG TPA: protein kinase, partial [Candidatus Acidoferrum sp.]